MPEEFKFVKPGDSSGNQEDELTKLSDEGWEFVAMTTGGDGSLRILVKRERSA